MRDIQKLNTAKIQTGWHSCWMENPKLKKDKIELYKMDEKTKIMEKSAKKSKTIIKLSAKKK
jgi:hypothetical protein